MMKVKAINKAHKLLIEGAIIIDHCLFNPTLKGTLIDHMAKELLGP